MSPALYFAEGAILVPGFIEFNLYFALFEGVVILFSSPFAAAQLRCRGYLFRQSVRKPGRSAGLFRQDFEKSALKFYRI